MRSVFITGCFLFVLVSFSKAQKQTYTIKVGESISDVLSLSDIYQYPQFVTGKVYFLSGGVSTSKLNYNLLNGEMQFINSKGDTSSVAQENQLKYIVIEKDTFLFGKGWHRVVVAAGDTKLVKKTVFRDHHKKIGGYGQPSSTSSIAHINSIASNTGSYNLKISEEIDLTRVSTFSIVDPKNDYYPADKKNILRLSGNRKKVEEYLDKNSVRFANEEDLLRLFDFLKTM